MNASRAFTDRQQREIDYHRDRQRNLGETAMPLPSLEIVERVKRRWWNAYWHLYTYLRSLDLRGKRACIIGCGFGNDAIFLNALGAETHASDLSAEMIDTAKRRCQGLPIMFSVMPAEKLDYPDAFFDLVLAVDILHHADIPATLTELQRVAKPGATFVWDEIYRHSSVAKLRYSVIGKWAWRRLKNRVYQNQKPYITEDECPISERDVKLLNSYLSDSVLDYFNFTVGRLWPDTNEFTCKIDRCCLRLMGPMKSAVACRSMGHGKFRSA